MARKKKDNPWNDIDGGNAFVIPNTLLRHANFTRLSHYANKLIHDLARQYTGHNNGYLCASFTLMKDAGWKSSETLWRTIRECEHYKLIVRTQQGSKNKPNLHAFTWRRINEVAKKPLEMLPTLAPTNDWKEIQPAFDLLVVHRKRKIRKQVARAA